MATALFTIGYQGLALDQFLAMLAARRVEQLLDVRELPLSRRRGFSKTPLHRELAAIGIDYVHLREAGNPYRRDLARLEPSAVLAKYRAYLNRTRAIVPHVTEAVRGHRTALLCFEQDVATCHRSILGPRVARKLGVPVTHL